MACGFYSEKITDSSDSDVTTFVLESVEKLLTCGVVLNSNYKCNIATSQMVFERRDTVAGYSH